MTDNTVFSQPIAKEQAKLNTLVENANETLLEVKSLFPFDFFTDSVIIDKTKVNLIYRVFFFSQKVFPILIKDIRNVSIDTNLFFATLTFEIKGYEVNPQSVNYLPKSMAVRAHNIIVGLVSCDRESVDISKLTREEVLRKVEHIGQPSV